MLCEAITVKQRILLMYPRESYDLGKKKQTSALKEPFAFLTGRIQVRNNESFLQDTPE